MIGSWIQQLSDDGGTTADLLNGFVGRAFGVGPILTYSTKLEKSHLDFNALGARVGKSQPPGGRPLPVQCKPEVLD